MRDSIHVHVVNSLKELIGVKATDRLREVTCVGDVIEELTTANPLLHDIGDSPIPELNGLSPAQAANHVFVTQTLRHSDLLAHVLQCLWASARVGVIQDFESDFLIIGGRGSIHYRGETLTDLSLYLIAVECSVWLYHCFHVYFFFITITSFPLPFIPLR